jgi:hypothetical protein
MTVAQVGLGLHAQFHATRSFSPSFASKIQQSFDNRQTTKEVVTVELLSIDEINTKATTCEDFTSRRYLA